MTTIAARETKKGVEFAYDTRATWHHNIDGTDKVFTNGAVTFAVSGTARMVDLLEFVLVVPHFEEADTDIRKWSISKLVPEIVKTFRDAAIAEVRDEQVDLCIQGIFTVRGFCAYLDPGGAVVPNPEGYYAVGSGSQFAIGALAQGATPEEAVAIAARYDSYTGGPIRTLFVPNTKERQ